MIHLFIKTWQSCAWLFILSSVQKRFLEIFHCMFFKNYVPKFPFLLLLNPNKIQRNFCCMTWQMCACLFSLDSVWNHLLQILQFCVKTCICVSYTYFLFLYTSLWSSILFKTYPHNWLQWQIFACSLWFLKFLFLLVLNPHEMQWNFYY